MDTGSSGKGNKKNQNRVFRDENIINTRVRRVKGMVFGGLIWFAAILAGLHFLLEYEFEPGRQFEPPGQFPSQALSVDNSTRSVIVMTAHPHCPCTRASIGELAIIMSRCAGLVDAYVLFYRPEYFPDGWEKSALWESAARIPGVTPVSDADGIKAGQFRAALSGQTMLYAANGDILFSGGITASRGHSGDNTGRTAIESLLLRGPADYQRTAAYGCALFSQESACSTCEER